MEESGSGPPRRRRRWPLIGGLALAFALTLGVGTFLGATLLHTAQAAADTSNGSAAPFAPAFPVAGTPAAHGPGGQGPCVSLTVSSVSGQTITAKAADGSTMTIHTNASTKYTKAGQSATASAVTAGAQIHVMGTRNSDGSITATSVDVV